MNPNKPVSEAILAGPIALAPDRFTPLAKTPWAGRKLSAHYKRAWVKDPESERIGEAWDFSCDPKFPSVVADGEVSLPELVRLFPQGVLGRAWRRGEEPFCEVMVKVLEAGEPLSVQVHPTDDDPDLKPDECGKPESWLVVEADAGAGVYLGFRKPVERAELARALVEGDAAKEYLHFVPVKPGDYFDIAPGVPHSLGPGVVILEPQRIAAGRSGMTYRLWDWGRRYDAAGKRDDAHGAPRALHVREGLKLVDPRAQVGDAFVDSLRRHPEVIAASDHARVLAYPANEHYKVFWIEGTGFCRIDLSDVYGVVDVLGGAGFLGAANGPGRVAYRMGQPFLLPAAAASFVLDMREASSVALVVPALGKAEVTLAR